MDLFYALPADKAETLHLWLQNNHNFEVLQMVDEKKNVWRASSPKYVMISGKQKKHSCSQYTNTWRGEG
jgi:hypothetical protein